MIKEIHHRVKNNLQIISSLLGLQSSNCHNAEVNDALIISSNRVKTMALIHENLYRSHDLSEIQFDIYLNDILFNIFNSYRVDQKDIRLKTDIAHEIMDADTAIHVGLLANELVTNALKYAFKNKVEGEIFVSFKRINGINYQLVISDNGIGLPEGFNIKSSNSLGLMLVNGFIDQLNGKLTIEQDKGTTFIISF